MLLNTGLVLRFFQLINLVCTTLSEFGFVSFMDFQDYFIVVLIQKIYKSHESKFRRNISKNDK